MNIKTLLIKATVALSFFTTTFIYAETTPLTLDVYRADEQSFHVSSVLIEGETEAILVDAQFTNSAGHQLVAKILDSGKTLKAVYISHGDPDYYFGLDVIKQAFPDVPVYSTANTLAHIKKTHQKKMDYWGPKLGANAPKSIIFPEVLEGNELTVDGHTLQIKGLDNHPERTYVWIPSISAIIGGVNVYGNLHLWIADAPTKEARQNWQDITDEKLALNPETVIAAHALADAPNDKSTIEYTREYLAVYEEELAKVDNSVALIEAMQKRFPDAGLGVALSIGAKVATGEMTW